ncbi:MAG: zinc-dependent metalloprotease [Aeromicrobium erythreum]
MIDWDVARGTAAWFAGPGPQVSAAEASEAVAQLRELADEAGGPVREYTRLEASSPGPALVVDRRRWTEANIASFEVLMDPVVDKLTAGRAGGPVAKAVGSRVAGAEVGALLAFMSSKVLGQFDPFWEGPAGEPGRLLLVAPNIVEVERRLDVDPRDFRAWVCLHEETHRVQFTAVPWMRDHVRSLMDAFVDATDTGTEAVSRFVADAAGHVKRLRSGEDVSLADLFQNERQREVVAQVTGVMSLLEGHADVVMDGVGPQVVPSVATIRRRFEQRRQGQGTLDRLLRKLLGLDAKMRQYRDGAAFVRSVEEVVGLDGLNAVWSEPANLPSAAEILDPAAWVRRVHG